MTKFEARRIFYSWRKCEELEPDCGYDCNNCKHDVSYEQLLEAMPIAIKCIERCEHNCVNCSWFDDDYRECGYHEVTIHSSVDHTWCDKWEERIEYDK